VENPVLIPGDCAMRLRHYATPGTRAFTALESAIKRDPPTSGPLAQCPILCDSHVIEELLEIAARYSPADVQIIADAYKKAFNIEL
jgi:hypothetical protein